MNQQLANASVQAVHIDSTDDVLDTAVNKTVDEKTQAFIGALPHTSAVAGFYHQLRIMPLVDYSSEAGSSITLQIDEYHPIGTVSTRYESWIVSQGHVFRPLLEASAVKQLSVALHLKPEDLKHQIGQPLAFGLLPNYQVRFYAGGVLASLPTPYVDIPLTKVTSLAGRFRDKFYGQYPVRPSKELQNYLDAGFILAMQKRAGPTDCERESCLALTFDDGPDANITPLVLKTLYDNKIKATFFFLGNQVQRSPEVVRQVASAGHEIENHTFSHQDLARLRHPEQIRKQIDDTQAALAGVGVSAHFLRPPYGSINDVVKTTANMPLIVWNIDSQEWRTSMSPDAMAGSIISQARPGAIILMHDTHRVSAEALPKVISQLQMRGFRFVTVAELLHIDGTARGVFASR